MKRIVAIIGDYYHEPERIRQSLEQALLLPDGSRLAEVIYAEAESLSQVLKERPDAVVLFKEDRVNPTDALVRGWMVDALEEEIVRYVHNGGGWFAWHSGLASYAEDGAYCCMLRGHFAYHPDQHRTVRYRIQGGEALGISSEGGSSFEFVDEHYFVVCDRSQTGVFLVSESEDGQSTAGWSHEFGAGRVCCLTPAHTAEGLMHLELIALVHSAIRWCSHAG